MDNSIFFHVSDQELSPSNSVYENITNIDNYDNESIEKVVIQNMCDYLKKADVPLALEKIFQKLKQKGELYIQGTDLKQLCVALTFNMIESPIIKDILYPNKQSIHHMSEILVYLSDIGFNIKIKKYSNIVEYYIVVNKP